MSAVNRWRDWRTYRRALRAWKKERRELEDFVRTYHWHFIGDGVAAEAFFARQDKKFELLDARKPQRKTPSAQVGGAQSG